MKHQLKKIEQGFSIVEVMIVLAIAGLILAIVFLAVPQLQRNTRDNQRQNMVTRIKAELDTFAANNQGKYPFVGVGAGWIGCNTQAVVAQNCGDFFTRYLNNVNINDPASGNPVTVSYSNSTTLPAALTAGDVYISVGSSCSGDSFTGGGGTPNSKKYGILAILDRTNTRFCVDNG